MLYPDHPDVLCIPMPSRFDRCYSLAGSGPHIWSTNMARSSSRPLGILGVRRCVVDPFIFPRVTVCHSAKQLSTNHPVNWKCQYGCDLEILLTDLLRKLKWCLRHRKLGWYPLNSILLTPPDCWGSDGSTKQLSAHFYINRALRTNPNKPKKTRVVISDWACLFLSPHFYQGPTSLSLAHTTIPKDV